MALFKVKCLYFCELFMQKLYSSLYAQNHFLKAALCQLHACKKMNWQAEDEHVTQQKCL